MKGKRKLRMREKEKSVTTEDGVTQDDGGMLVRCVYLQVREEYVRTDKIRYKSPIDTTSVQISPTSVHVNI